MSEDRIVLDLDEIVEPERIIRFGGKEYLVRNLSLGEQFKYQALVETAERLKAADNAEGYSIKMRAATLMLIPELEAAEFEKLYGKRLSAFMDFVMKQAASSKENPTEAQSES